MRRFLAALGDPDVAVADVDVVDSPPGARIAWAATRQIRRQQVMEMQQMVAIGIDIRPRGGAVTPSEAAP